MKKYKSIKNKKIITNLLFDTFIKLKLSNLTTENFSFSFNRPSTPTESDNFGRTFYSLAGNCYVNINLYGMPICNIGVKFKVGDIRSKHSPQPETILVYMDLDKTFENCEQDIVRGIVEESRYLKKYIEKIYYNNRFYNLDKIKITKTCRLSKRK